MVHAGKRDRSEKSSQWEKLKLKKRKLKKGKVKEEISDTQSSEIDLICSGNGDHLKVTRKGEEATAAEAARNELTLKKKKRKEEMFHGDLGDPKKKKRGEKRNKDDSKNASRRENNARRENKEVPSLRRENSVENKGDAEEETVKEISSVDEDCSRGMKKWVLNYHQRRPGLEIVQQRLGEFMAAYEAEQEQARKDREALAAEGGWTVVVHHKGRKKTTDSESGIAVGSVAQAAVEEKVAKKKQKELALDFYRFQKRETQRNEVMMLQSKFEQDKKRLQQLRAARKFRPY
uniref:Ribosomal RNA-processing protein 7 A n=2 Tax=Anthurium amnicola TaxID=1678845 RepID=A0A1D1Z4Y9_9ARAE